MLTFSQILQRILEREHLSSDELSFLIEGSIDHTLSAVQVSAWLTAFRAKYDFFLENKTYDLDEEDLNLLSQELAVFVSIFRKYSTSFKANYRFPLIDTCGTGGDTLNIVNISTLSALTLAALGYPVAKHGNRSVSSKCGSADLLEDMGYSFLKESSELSKELLDTNFTFFFAPYFHIAMKEVAPIRKELGIRTIFNILGPLLNPALADVQLLGVFSPNYISLISETLKHLHVSSAMVVHSQDGLDEISPMATTKYALLYHDQDVPHIISGEFDPSRIVEYISNIRQIEVVSREDAFKKAKQILMGTFQEGIEAVALNVAACIFLYQISSNKKVTTLVDDVEASIRGRFNEVQSFLQESKVLDFCRNKLGCHF